MPALFEQGFFVRKPAWHGLGEVLDDYPGREEAMRLAGHDFDLVPAPLAALGASIPPGEEAERDNFARIVQDGQTAYRSVKPVPDYKALAMKCADPGDPRHGTIIGVVSDSFEPIQNSVPWDVIDAICTPRPGFTNAHYETGATLDGGRTCFVTAWLDEPRTVTGDDSPIYPYAACNWGHVGNGAFRLIRTSIREVCANTVAMAEAEAESTGFSYTFRHTKNVMERIEDAKLAIQGIALATDEFIEMAEDLAKLQVTPEQRELFVTQLRPAPPESLISDRVMSNVEKDRAAIRALFEGPTIPDAHALTGYGLFLAGTEFLDHLRGYRNTNTYVGRTLLSKEPLKARLSSMIREVAVA